MVLCGPLICDDSHRAIGETEGMIHVISACIESEEWLMQATIQELQRRMERGEITSRELVLRYLNRIAKFDQSGPRINSVLEINPDALFVADALDYERRANGSRGPLHGIPILVKDNIDTCDKMHTSAGSLALANHYAATDAFVVRKLRESGAVILGKTNMTEWANLMSSHMPAGYSSRGGQVLNPYGPGEFFVGGSSSGSAAAVAAGFAAAAIGTETSGSILSPACQNALVGIKPTVGLVSRSGVIPVSNTQDTIGPIAKCVSDAAIILSAISGTDELDTATWSQRFAASEDYMSAFQPNGFVGATIGIPRKGYFESLSPDETEIIEKAIHDLGRAGVVIIDDIDIPSSQESWDYGVAWMELKTAINNYLGKSAPTNRIRSLRDIIQFNEDHAEQTLQYGQDVFTSADRFSGALTEPDYLSCLMENLEKSRARGIDHALKTYRLDALLYPHDKGYDMPARAGYPSITVPAGYTSQGRPIGIQFTGEAYSEMCLIRIAYAFEQATRHRIPPRL